MTFEDFDKFQEALLKEVVAMKNTKGLEYAAPDDRFANFNADAAELGVDRLTAAMIFCNKHIRSIKQAIKTKQFEERAEPLRGRFVDVIVYMTLIAGMIEESQSEDLKNKLKLMEQEQPPLAPKKDGYFDIGTGPYKLLEFK